MILVNGERGNIRLGGNGQNGSLAIFHKDVTGNDLFVYRKAAIYIDGKRGDIKLQGADCAEEFEASCEMEPGTVAVIGDDGRVEPCNISYDTRAVGAVTGAGDFRPGITLGRRPEGLRAPIALLGKTYCLVDARKHRVRPGDALVASDTEGHAMVCSDVTSATGAVIGQALASLDGEIGLLPMLIGRR
jgi:hypothetical protein